MNEQKLAQSLFVQLVTCTIANSISLRGLFFHCRTYLNCKKVWICIGYVFMWKKKKKETGALIYTNKLHITGSFLISFAHFITKLGQMPSLDNSKWSSSDNTVGTILKLHFPSHLQLLVQFVSWISVPAWWSQKEGEAYTPDMMLLWPQAMSGEAINWSLTLHLISTLRLAIHLLYTAFSKQPF